MSDDIRIFGHLMRAKLRSLTNYRRSGRGGWRRLAALLVLGVAVWVGILLASHWFLGRVASIEPIGVVMVRKLLSLVLIFVLSILTVSNLIAALSTLFLADDLPALIARPVPTYALYAARWVENAVYASWMTLAFVTPFYVAAGMVLGAPPAFYGTLAIVLPVMATIPTSVAVTFALLLGRIMSARRTRQILVVLATLVFTVLFVLFRRLEPERFVDPDQRAPLLEVLQRVQGGDSAWLPSTWASEALWQHIGLSPGHDAPVLLLITFALSLFFVGAWCFRATHSVAFSLAQQAATEHETRATRERTDAVPLATLAERLRSRRPTSTRGAFARKDLRVFIRDTAQWTQMLLLSALVAIYVVNFSYIRTAGQSGIISATGLHFINLALGGFVAVAVCVRFAFPAISLEGRAFWVVLCSPNRSIDLLRGKWRSLAVPLSAISATLVGITSVWLGSGAVLAVAAVATVVPLTTGLVGLALGLGARFPRFEIDNAAKIATGLGGVLYMFIGLGVLLAAVLLAVMPTMALEQWVGRGLSPTPGRVALGAALGLLSVTVPVVAGWLSVRIGAAHLQREGMGA
ncbi:MAG: hypothetical protein AAF721_34795 [Myxococcota bacterium]